MTLDSYLIRGLVFLITFSIATLGLFGSFEAIAFDWNTASYFFNVGSIFFAGVFCVGKANRYLLLTFVSIVFVNYLLTFMLDLLVPLSAYLRVCIYAVVSIVALAIIKRRNVLTMRINSIRRSESQSIVSTVVKSLFKSDLPTRETNLSLAMTSYARAYLYCDLLFIPLAVSYFMYVGVGFDELFGSYVMSGEAFNIGLVRDFALFVLDFLMCVSLMTYAIYDSKRPDSLGVGKTVTWDKALERKLAAERQ
jgi:hypothetical protein